MMTQRISTRREGRGTKFELVQLRPFCSSKGSLNVSKLQISFIQWFQEQFMLKFIFLLFFFKQSSTLNSARNKCNLEFIFNNKHQHIHFNLFKIFVARDSFNVYRILFVCVITCKVLCCRPTDRLSRKTYLAKLNVKYPTIYACSRI